MLTEWPTAPPEPTDLNQTHVTSQLPVRNCVYCNSPIKQGDGYVQHVSACEKEKGATHVHYPNGFFGIVVPEQSGYVWVGKTGGFACRNVAIQGVMIPLGHLRTLNFDAEPPDLDGKFGEFDDPDEARKLYLKGMRETAAYEYGGEYLGSKLVAETLDGVYTDDEDVREERYNSRDDRVMKVWDEIDAELPFMYDRVVAPVGRPVTQEGLRWIHVTGHADDDPLFREPWVDTLIERDSPVALYYPNSD